MVEEELMEILTEYKAMAESEHSSFINSIVSTSNFSTLVFNSLQAFEERIKNVDILPPLCDLLLNIFRRDPEYRYFSLQFLPHLAFIYLLNYGEKVQFSSIETLLISIHNIESREPISFRIGNLSQNSIYHEAHQINDARTSNVPEVPMDKNGAVTVEKVPPPLVMALNSQNKLRVISFLFGVYVGQLMDMSRQSVEFTCKLCSRMIMRGFSVGGRNTQRRNVSYGSDSGVRSPRLVINRLSLSASLLLEMCQLGYFAIYNQSYTVGLNLIRDIEFRGKHSSMDSVLLVSRALIKMAPSGPSQEEQRYISTPSQLSKNIITNASFRTKKLEGDIPRVEPDEEGQPSSELAKMGVIVEEEETGQDGKKLKEGVENIADKIKARMEIVRMRKKERMSETESTDKARGSEKKDKKKERKEGKNSAEPETLEDIRLHTFPSETIAIHSPESGSTSIF